MAKHRSNDAITSTPPAHTSAGITDTPACSQSVPPSPARRSAVSIGLLLTGIVVVAVIGAGVILWQLDDKPAAAPPEPHSKKYKDSDDWVFQRFAELRNAGDPAANALLGRVPAVPDGAIEKDDVESLETSFFLANPDLKIVEVRNTWKKLETHILVTKGNVSAPRLSIRNRDGEVSNQQRTMSNPDLFVYVRDGKIFGVRSKLHHDLRSPVTPQR